MPQPKKEYTLKQLEIIVICTHGTGLKVDSKGRFYYHVPSSVRRNNRMLVSQKEIDQLKKANLI